MLAHVQTFQRRLFSPFTPCVRTRRGQQSRLREREVGWPGLLVPAVPWGRVLIAGVADRSILSLQPWDVDTVELLGP